MSNPSAGTDEEHTPDIRPGPHRAIVALLLLAAIAFSSAARIGIALNDPELDRASADGLLKSDPGLLYYFTERIVEAGGLPPDDFRADPRTAWPETSDLPATFSVGQEFLVAWCQLITRSAFPLHMTALFAMAISASIAVLGAYGIARALTGSRWMGLVAAGLWCALPANYRTVGFLLIREDLSWPLFALHLALFLRALARPNPRTFFAAGLALAAALATWHAMAFFVALEGAALFTLFLVAGRNPFATRGAGWMGVPVLAAALVVPVLRSTVTLLSPALIGGVALFVAARVPKARPTRTLAAGSVIVLGILLRSVFAEALGEHAHVYEVLAAKLAHFGELPSDPNALSFDARLLWQGPFETLRLSWAPHYLGLALLAVPVAALLAPGWRGGTRGSNWSTRDSRATIALLTLLSLPTAWLVSRTVILPGLLLPVLLAVAVAGLRRPSVVAWAGALLLGLQALFFADYARGYLNPWYRPVGRQAELAQLVRALPELVPESDAIAADFMTSTAVLAHTRRPVLLQPKYETDASRRRIEEFLTTFFRGEPQELRALLMGKYRCRYLLVDRFTLGYLSRYTAGLAPGEEPAPGSCAAVFLSQDEATLGGVPGFELIYRSPPTILQRDGSPYDLFRLYRIEAR